MTRTSFGDQLQQMWHTRPVRLPRQGPVAGVAAGFGRRYHIDPVLIRVAFVVSTLFGGAGIVLYLLAWLLLSQAGDENSAAESLFGKGGSSQSPTKTIVLIVALAIAVTTMGPVGMGLAGSGAISLALMLAGWWMLHMRTPQPPPGTSQLDNDTGFGGLGSDSGSFDGGLTATGYPGAVFPSGTAGSFYAPDNPISPVYTPYTKLPDTYVPDPAPPATEPATDTAAHASQPTVDLRKGDAATVLEPGDSAPTEADEDRSAESSDSAARTAPPDDGPGGAPSVVEAAPPRTGHIPVMAGTTPPSWDPLGVAPLAWDLPEPTPARTVVAPPPERPRSRYTPVVIGLAILAAACAGAAAASGVEWMTPARIAAVALAVVGVGLVAGVFLRRGGGLLVVTAPLAAFAVAASLIGPIEFDRTAMGDRTWTPATMADLETDYHLSMGSGTLDLRSLRLTENRTVDLSIRMGEARVLLPADMTVRTVCTVSMGDQTCPTGVSGPNTPGAPVLDLNVDVRMGEVRVERG